ncbi:hypothetical protein AHiyo4_01690 [Arthrobacter sp. Hiyo4]|nr:hypothetical protein AHiyo4_01690 [Arthrobacter sp. Hiyo4]
MSENDHVPTPDPAVIFRSRLHGMFEVVCTSPCGRWMLSASHGTFPPGPYRPARIRGQPWSSRIQVRRRRRSGADDFDTECLLCSRVRTPSCSQLSVSRGPAGRLVRASRVCVLGRCLNRFYCLSDDGFRRQSSRVSQPAGCFRSVRAFRTSLPSCPALRRIMSGSWPSRLPGLTECFMMHVWSYGENIGSPWKGRHASQERYTLSAGARRNGADKDGNPHGGV